MRSRIVGAKRAFVHLMCDACVKDETCAGCATSDGCCKEWSDRCSCISPACGDSAESCPPLQSRSFAAGECDLRRRSCIIYAMRNVTCAVAEKCASGLTSYPRRSVRGICVAPTRVWRVQSRAQRGAALALVFRVWIVCQSLPFVGIRTGGRASVAGSVRLLRVPGSSPRRREIRRVRELCVSHVQSRSVGGWEA